MFHYLHRSRIELLCLPAYNHSHASGQRGMMARALLLTCFLLVLPGLLSQARAELDPSARAEVSHLLEYVEKSGCEFYRNGTWHKDTKGVRDHAELKLRYFEQKGRINSAEDFIKWAGSKSEISGKPYMVKCNDGPPIPTSQWLSEELQRYRKQKASVPGK
jgi:hypothetical protein